MEYVNLSFRCSLPEPLFQELTLAARTCGLRPADFVAQALEAALAERRLPFVEPAPHGARIDLEPEVIT